jgi:2,3-dimethylmalate lyase
VFIEALTSQAEAEEAVRAFPAVPLLFNWAEGGKTPPIGLDRLKEPGYRIVIFPISTLLTATGAMRWILQEIAEAGTPAAAMGAAPGIDRLIVFGGGYPITVGEAVVGAIGVSGGHYSQDMEVAQAGLSALTSS